MRSIRHPAGFSLLELLVALAVMSLLLALIAPAVMQSRESARRTHCKNNLKNIGVALANYFDVHREAFPQTPTIPSLLPFLEQPNVTASQSVPILVCPSQGQQWPFALAGTSYLTSAFVTGRRLPCVTDTKSETVFIGESNKQAVMIDGAETAGTDLADSPHGRNVGGNLLFVDGRVRFVSASMPVDLQAALWLPDDGIRVGLE